MKQRWIPWMGIAVVAAAGAALIAADQLAEKQALTKKLWPKERIEAALQAVEKQRTDGLLSQQAYRKRKQMLEERLAGRYVSQSLSVTDPPLNFIQNGGFETVNRNSAKDRSRWAWWSGWSWGGDYENHWESRPEHVHSGKFSARIQCTGRKGRIGIFTPPLPAVPGAKGYELTFWAKAGGENLLYVAFESGASGGLRQKIGPAWKQYTLTGQPEPSAKTYKLYVYSVGEGTMWLDDIKLVPIGGGSEE